MHCFLRTLAGRLLALALCLLSGPLSCVPGDVLEPRGGAIERELPALVPVPGGGVVNAAAGNLIVARRDLAVDTPLGTWAIGATYNAATGEWSWSHRMHYDGLVFTDASGARHEVAALPDGAPVPGTGWQRVDGSTLRTRGGLEHRFGADGFLAGVRWATLDYPHVALDATSISLCTRPAVCTPLFAIALAQDGQPAVLTELRSGREARFGYDAAGRLIEARSPSDVEQGAPGTRYQYASGDTLLVASTTPEGERVEYAYQPGRRIDTVTQIGEGDPRHVFRFAGRTDDGRYRSFHRNPTGGLTRYEFDAERRLLRTEHEGTGDVVVREWSGMRPSRVIRPGGVVTELVYVDDRLVEETTPAGNRIRYVHAPGALQLDDPFEAPLARIEDSLGLLVERSYDAAGRLVRERNAAGEEVVIERLGSAVSARTQVGVTVDFLDFGAHGHWRTAEIAGRVVSRRAFDLVGDPIVPQLDARPGGTLGQRFDASRRLTSIERAASDEHGRVASTDEIGVVRRSDGRLVAIERPGGGDHAVAYDALGRAVAVRERVAGVWHTTAIEYDAAGNQTARERANGMREEYEYDAFGRMLLHRALRDGVLEGEEEFFWADGRLVARYDSIRDLTEVYAYDAAGRLASTAFGHGETIARAYDLRDRLVAEVFSIPGVGVVADVGYGYDAAGRVVRLEDRTTGETLAEDVWEQGRPVESLTANGLVRAYEVDAEGQLVGMQTRDGAAEVVETTSITRASAIGPPRFEIASTTTTPLATSKERYWLPAGTGLAQPDQRVGKRLFGWHDGAGRMRHFAWDALGNPADDASGNTFVHDASGSRLLEASLADGNELDFAWDPAGFATARNGVPLEWTATGRLARHGGDELVWDLAGRLVEARIDGTTRRYLRFGGRVESDLTSVGWLDYGAVAIHLGSGARRYRHFDFRGNVSFVSDDAGRVVAHHRYHPFGLDASWGAETGGPAFERQPSLGALALLGERVLDPLVGRFLSPDPVLDAVNQYAYALGNPIWFQDRDGRQMTNREAWEIGLQLVAVAVGVVALSTGLGLIPATAIAVQAALKAGAVVGFIAAGVNLIDKTLDALESASPSRAVGFPPQRPPQPQPSPQPAPAAAPTGQLKVIEIDLEFGTRLCTPLGRGASPGPLVLLLFAIAQLVAFGVWWRRGPEASS